MLGEGGDARVLEPSPPAVALAPWFADDPTEGRPLDWSAYDLDVAWREERWLGPFRRLAVLPARDLQRLEDLEDAAEARAALAAFSDSDGKSSTAAAVRQRLGQ